MQDNKIYQEESLNSYRHGKWSGIHKDSGYLWDEIKDRVATGDYEEYAEPEPNYADLRRFEYPPIGDQCTRHVTAIRLNWMRWMRRQLRSKRSIRKKPFTISTVVSTKRIRRKYERLTW